MDQILISKRVNQMSFDAQTKLSTVLGESIFGPNASRDVVISQFGDVVESSSQPSALLKALPQDIIASFSMLTTSSRNTDASVWTVFFTVYKFPNSEGAAKLSVQCAVFPLTFLTITDLYFHQQWRILARLVVTSWADGCVLAIAAEANDSSEVFWWRQMYGVGNSLPMNKHCSSSIVKK